MNPSHAISVSWIERKVVQYWVHPLQLTVPSLRRTLHEFEQWQSRFIFYFCSVFLSEAPTYFLGGYQSAVRDRVVNSDNSCKNLENEYHYSVAIAAVMMCMQIALMPDRLSTPKYKHNLCPKSNCLQFIFERQASGTILTIEIAQKSLPGISSNWSMNTIR